MKVNTNNVLRHNYAIWVMGRRPGWFKPQRYMYRCLRCKWAFMVNDDHSGSVRVAGDRRRLTRRESSAGSTASSRSVPRLSDAETEEVVAART